MKKTLSKIMRANVTSVILASIVIGFIFSVSSDGFLSNNNIINILKTSSVTIAIGLAQMVVLSVGQFNLALGAIGCFTAMTYAWLMQVVGLDPIIAVLCALVTGVILGAFQGIMVTKTGLNPFIVTLALDSVIKGLATIVFQGQLLNKLPDAAKAINKTDVFGIPTLFVISLVLVLVMEIYMNHTIFGRKLLATGESSKAALVGGLQPQRQIITAHVISGILCACAAILTVSRLGAAQLSVGADWMLMSTAAPVLGGTLLSGGKVSPIGTIFGAILLNMISYGLVMMNVNLYWAQFFMGVILVASFAVDYLRDRMAKSGKSHA